jgi:hypothetical protein
MYAEDTQNYNLIIRSIIIIIMALQPFVRSWQLFQFLDFYTVDRTPWTGDQPFARPLPTHGTQAQNKGTQYRHPCFVWDSYDPSVRASEDSSCLRPRGYCDRLASERAKTVHALNCAATVIGNN